MCRAVLRLEGGPGEASAIRDLVHDYIQNRAGSGGGCVDDGDGDEDGLALHRLYAIHLLCNSLRQPSQARAWLTAAGQEPACSLSASQQQQLLQELDDAAAAGLDGKQAADGSSGQAREAGAEGAAAVQHGPNNPAMVDSIFDDSVSHFGAAMQDVLDGLRNASRSTWAWLQGSSSSGDSGGGGSSGGGDAARRGPCPASSAAGSAAGGAPAVVSSSNSLRWAVCTAAAGLLLYAIYTERGTISTTARRKWEGLQRRWPVVKHMMGDLATMGLSLTPR